MDVAASKASVTTSSGQSTNCGTVFVGTSVFVNQSGWFLPAGFVMKGYTGGTTAKPVTQLLYVEYAGVTKAAGETLSINYSYITGPFNYYVASGVAQGTLKIDLDKLVKDTKYPVAASISGLIKKSDAVVSAINSCTVQWTDAKRTDTGLEFSWQSTNGSRSLAYVHIGEPPVIGADGIMYGFYTSPHLSDAPITPAGDKATWTSEVAVPKDVTGLYILVLVESKQQKYFVDHVLDITDK